MTIVHPSVVKQLSEVFSVSVDFGEDLATGETISTPTVTARNEKTGADTSAAVLEGTPTPSGTKLIQKVKNGVNGKNHILTFKIVTSAGNTFESEARAMVREEV